MKNKSKKSATRVVYKKNTQSNIKTVREKSAIYSENKSECVFHYGELFSGPGGLALGAKNASVTKDSKIYRIEHAWATDYSYEACETYRNNICPDKPETVRCIDIRELDIKSLPKIDAFAFGFPCNDFSLVGQQKGFDGNFGGLYKFGVNVLDHFKPKFFVAENVGGIQSSNEGKAFRQILKELFEVGYDLFPHMYKFEEYGVPQTRRRVIIVGMRQDLNLVFRIPKPSGRIRTSREAIEKPPIVKGAPNHDYTTQSKTVVERLKHIKPGQNAFNSNLPDHLSLNVKGAKISQIYRRLLPEKPAYTITGSGGGGTHVYHWSENRALTNRERARLQTFPDDFVFVGTKEAVRKQIGMAVPPKVAEVIFRTILKTFAHMDYPSIKQNIEPTYEIPEQLELV